ncbi:hypothetical protein EDD11_002741 [Mortierella claussenii]|nr:hypothetical protein EDD11_002741 [Mortierella claussenii]
MGTQATEPSGTIMSRSWSIGGTMQTPVFWRRDDRSESSEFGFDDSDSNSESEETKDDFDDSIHLAGPFQLLLVSRRLADAAIQSLWRNLVFHGHDVYQMQSLLSTLAMDDGVSGDHSSADSSHHPSGLEELKEVSEEDEDKDQNGKRKNHPGGEQDTLMDRNVVEMKTGPTAARCIVRSSNLGTNEHRLPRRVSGGYKPISQTIAAAPREPASHSNASLLSSRQPTTAGAHQRPISLGTHGKQGANSQRSSSRDDRHHSSQLSSSKSRQNETRWPYRRHVRRVVLNFAHPQASPQMLVKTLECLSQRCYGQILALDLHANEKMRDGGLEKLEEMERLFGYGFSKLRYLRLQGGFVDNQLLGSLIKGLTLPGPASLDHPSIGHARHYASPSPGSLPPYTASPCRLSQVFLGPGSVTDSAVDKLIAAAGHSLEVFVVTSCVDVGGGALASLLTKCRKLRVLSVHRSLARDRDLLEGLGIEVEALAVNHLHAEMTNVSSGVGLSTVGHVSSSRPASPSTPRPEIVAPLERLELGIVKLSRVGVTEILKGTCETLRYLVLETQHFSEELLTDVITPFCTRLEGLYFDDPEHLQRQQHQMQGLGFSVGRRGSHLPSRQFEFGRSRRTFYADPNRHYQPASQQHQQHFQHHLANPFMSGEPLKRKSSIQHNPKISAWLGETTTEEWIIYGDCALWTSAASPGISFNNGGAATGAQAPLNHHPRRQPLPLHHAYHSPEFLTSIEQASSSSSSRAAAYGMYQPNSFMGDYDDVLERYRVSRTTIENAMLSLQSLEAFTVVQLDFKLESQGVNERKALEWEDEMWRQSVGFRLLQVFYACLLLSPIFYGSLRW